MAAPIISTINYIIAGDLLSLCPGHTGLRLSTTSDKSIELFEDTIHRNGVLKEDWMLPILSISKCHKQCIEMDVDTPKMTPI